ncbi:TM0106 family RecB-like putative nuclease [Antrihabitans cavernicola]|uniref:TM0106 family RecB-like putative nuclease n=1 Tax=Antrihabitans cavernicola TaxID=2495913 RepID=A0A5A7SKS5_9NOCA|nr:TM0106 family RecB-like putative nuclease [Spelaeibacter cavernicola]KAA0025075.1 TM0106 family RecB-like putative nuclease [Spelaeibacter cavernicola]
MIDARRLTSCRHRLHLDLTHPLLIEGVGEDSGVRQRREAATAHRAAVRDTLTAVGDGWVVIDAGQSSRDRAEATLAAMAAGASRIWDAVLPSEPDTGRRGKSELLIRDDGRGGYIPVIVVNHKITDPRSEAAEGGAVTSDLFTWDPHDDAMRKVRPQLRDQLRLVHIYRMLQRHGYASPGLVGGAIGFGFDCILVHDLSTVLDEYDRRFADRIAVARGQVQTLPSNIPECRSCPWWSRCSERLIDMRDVSVVAPGSRAEVLRGAGVSTIDQLAGWVGDAPEDWQHGEFGDAVVTAKAWLRGLPLVRRVPNVRVQRADVEVDVDMESYQEHGAYLWGTLLNVDGTSEYRAFATWDPVPTFDEARSFAEFWGWLMQTRAQTVAAGKTFAAYCYSRAAEDKWLLDSARRFEGMPGIPTVEEILGFINGPEWVDIYQAVSDQFICPNGKGLKKVAPVAGFNWRDAEASGEASMSWYREAVGFEGEPDLGERTRLLEYNEDDVYATKVLREWMDARADAEIPFAGDL